jgi:hypothetical protein
LFGAQEIPDGGFERLDHLFPVQHAFGDPMILNT